MSEVAGRQPSGELMGGVLSSDFGLWRLVVNRRTGCSLPSVSDAPKGDSTAILETIYQRQF